ncbi:MAG: hypothetical protein OEV49_12515 [candidate division Zixibacteria bacterium]|nr:hypothetical protein [candidate division Zixibacteria bacterium]MDH3935901.1 hypothetical protein [candidate division Zixibacteria bacterium]MDH4032487.1 hypothetical protein [candidate division Zixibacteria bacterium]
MKLTKGSLKGLERNMTTRTCRLLTVALLVTLMMVSSTYAAGPKLVGAFFVKGKVGLKWTAVANASEYIIYRKDASSDFAKLGATDKTNYFDTQLQAGAVYTYKIAAVVDGAEIEGSTKDVKLPASIDAFSAPRGVMLRVNDRGNGISLRWDKVKGAIAYNVLRSSTAGSGHELVGNVSENSYNDKENLVGGTVYYYTVIAMNEEFEESGPSEEVTMKFGLSEEELAELAAAESTIDLDSIKLEFVFEVTEAEGTPLKNPTNLDINSKGDIYITDKNNQRVVCTDNRGNVKFTFGTGMESDERDDPPEGAFLSPFQLAIDTKDQVYVADVVTNNIQVFTADGKFIKRIIVPVQGEQSGLRANGLDIFDDGRIICSDVGNGRVLIIDDNGNILKEFNSGETFLAHYPNGVKIVDGNSFVHTNPVIGEIIVSNLNGEEQMRFGGMGTNIGVFGRAVAVAVSEDGMYWISDAMGSNVQAFNKEGEVKIVIPTNFFSEEKLQIAGPRGILVQDGMLYIVSERSHKLLAFTYQITVTED